MIWYVLGSIKFIWSSDTLEGTPHHGIFTNFLMIFFLDSNTYLVSKYFRIYLSEQLGYCVFFRALKPRQDFLQALHQNPVSKVQ